MTFSDKEASRDQGRPVHLYLLEGADPSLESMMRSVTIIPGTTQFGYGTTKIEKEIYEDLPEIADWDDPIEADGAVYKAAPGAPNAPSVSNELIGKTVIVEEIGVLVFAMDHLTQEGWFKWNTGGPIPESTSWTSTTYDPTIDYSLILISPENTITRLPVTDFVASVDELLTVSPELKHVSLVVAWHGTDLRCGVCQIKPRVEEQDLKLVRFEPYEWTAGSINRSQADLVSFIGDSPAVGGAPADRTIYEAITHLKSRGLRVTLYPFIMMDIPSSNTLSDPYSDNAAGVGQPTYPWRGRITCSPASGFTGTADKTATAATQIASFFGTVTPAHIGWDATNFRTTYSGPADEWSFRRFILTMARIAEAAGVDDFLIGSEMRGVTQVRDNTGNFPGVSQFIDLAASARSILGAEVRISYAADWSEYHSYRPADGTGDVLFNLDPLWSNSNINYIGVDNYLPLTDWRNTSGHLDAQDGYVSEYDKTYMRDNIQGGEYYDWFYADQTDRENQVRTNIEDTANEEDWVFRQKDFWNWWSNPHHNRPAGVRSETATGWISESKPIVFTEVGCPAVNLGANQPNVFFDTKSSESALPHFSNGRPDAYIQRVYLETWLYELRDSGPLNPISSVYDGPMFDMDVASIWTWDARPFPEFPEFTDIWSDGPNWQTGHWITGRVTAGRAFNGGDLGPFLFTNNEEPLLRDGKEYLPWAVTHGDVVSSGTLDKSDLEVQFARGTALDEMFVAYPPSQVMNLYIFKGHSNSTDTLFNFPLDWAGRIRGAEYNDNKLILNCEPVSTSIRRPGLRRHYQISCPHVLYGSECRASQKAATSGRVVLSVSGQDVTLTEALPGDPENYRGGLLEWQPASGGKEIRTILTCSEDMLTVKIRGFLRGIEEDTATKVSFGCNRFTSDCKDLHNNILNYGGQPWIPFDNPFSFVSKF